MTTKPKTNLKIVQPDLEQMEAVVTEAAQQSGPMVQRLATHRDRFDMALKELDREEADLVARRDLLQRQADAALSGLNMHIEDVRAVKALYTGGLNALPQPRD
jgi:16S rRNA U1498 N3-methylase RsmE